MASRVVGVDIGSATLRGVEVEGGAAANPRVMRYHEVPLPAGSAKNGEVLDEAAVASALKKLWAEGGFRTKDVVLGMGNQRVVARNHAAPRMTLAQIKESLPFTAQDLVPMPIDDALLDFYPISESVTEAGPVVNGLLVAAAKDAVSANVRAVQLAGLKPVNVDIIPFALSRVLTRNIAGADNVALIDIGDSTTTVVVVSDRVPQFVRIMPFGSGEITRAVAQRFGLEDHQAEAVKRRIGLDPVVQPAERQAAEVIVEATEEFLASVRNSISYFENSRPDATVHRVVLSGGGARLLGLRLALEELIRVDVQVADPFATVGAGRGVDPLADPKRDSMTVALGLALGSAA